MTTSTLSTDRTHYRELVAQVAARAKDKLPECNGRVEAAAALVLAGDVEILDAHTAAVASQKDPAKVYQVEHGACTCQDFARAPHGFCKHRLASAMVRRVHELLAAVPAPAPEVNTENQYQPKTVESAAPLPEAPASCNVYVTISGHKVQVTLRDADEQRMLARLQILLDRYPAPEKPADDTRQCPVHHVPMQVNHKDGRFWYSHKTADDWCKGK